MGADLHSGSELLGFRIERVLGRGGMGVVYLAHQLVLDRMVALKLLAPDLAEDSQFRARFIRESRLAASLDHPSIVPIFDAGEVDGHLYISMRYVEGSDLRQILDREAPLGPARATSLLAPIADALDTAHSKGLVHRDVKPSNILVDEAGRPYLADFGLSKEVADRGLLEASHFAASVNYAAPEQIERQPVGPMADVYALGCVLFECLTGAPPFDASSVVAVLFGHLNEPPPKASERNGTLPEAVDTILATALAKEGKRRQSSCAQLVADVEAALRPPAAVSRGRRRAFVVPTGLALIVVAGLTAFLLTRGGSTGAPGSADALFRIDPETNRIAERVATGHGSAGVAVGAGAVWVSSRDDGSVWRIDPQTHAVRRIPGFPEPGDISVGTDTIYVGFRDGVGAIDAVNLNRSARTISLGTSGQRPLVVAGPLGVWAADEISPAVDRLGLIPALGTEGVVERVPIDRMADEANGFDTLTGIAEGEGAVWVTGDALEPVLFRIEPETLRVSRFRLPSAPGGIAAGAGAVWVAGQLEDVVWRVDPRTGEVTDTFRVGAGVSSVIVGAKGVWVASSIRGTVSRIDPLRRKVVATIDVVGLPADIAAGEGGVWVVSRSA